MRAPHLDDGDVRLYLGDCVEVMREIDAESVDAVVCDPPYGLEFMGKEWDRADSPDAFAAWCETWAREALRVLKPGGHLLAFGGTRTFHRLTCGIEDAGFEVRDCLSWNYASGFPKSLDVSKAIDKAAGAEREVVATIPDRWAGKGSVLERANQQARESADLTAPATDAAREWQGWGTALKPAFEPVVVGLKPHTAQSALAVEAQHAKEELCAVVSCDAMDTSWSELLRTSGLSSIASSLLGCLDDLSQRASTFTTETASSLTTDLRIWRSCLSPITLATTTPARTLPPGASSYARDAVALSVSVFHKCERLAATTAGATAIAPPVVPALTPEFDPSSTRPAWEPCVVARKPLVGTVAANVQAHGTGALNIDGCRIAGDVPSVPQPNIARKNYTVGGSEGRNGEMSTAPGGRWPANVAFDEDAAAMLDAQSGESKSSPFAASTTSAREERKNVSFADLDYSGRGYTDKGGASRFFYTAKASRADRNAGGMAENTHPTVKPTDLMRWLVRLVTPPGGVVLDPFAGSGTTLVAARAEGFRAIGIEREEEYAQIIADRLSQLSLFSEAS